MLIFPEQNQISVLRQRSPARKSHSKRVWADAAPGRAHKKHDYCCSPFSFTIRATFSDETSGLPEVVALPRCKAELLPCQLVFDLRPFQYWQYASLRTAMFSQQRLDTMLHKRPSCRPTSNPSAWWRYAIGCVMARPNSRPWRDVLKIVKCRSRYFYLVKTKLLNASTAGGGSGFHYVQPCFPNNDWIPCCTSDLVVDRHRIQVHGGGTPLAVSWRDPIPDRGEMF